MSPRENMLRSVSMPAAFFRAPIRAPRCRSAARARAFTLIEIMVVVVIIGLLAAFVVPRVVGQVDQARTTKARVDIQKIEAALAMYRLDTSRYPTTEQGLKALVVQPENVRNWRPGGYLDKGSLDPWGLPYQYRAPGASGADFDIYSVGPDGEEGTPDKDADNISNHGLDAAQPQ